eukprot:1760861-Prorocentrum_lima.AAC.1
MANWAQAQKLLRGALQCAVCAMGPPSLNRPNGLVITDCNCRNILWIAADGKQEARLGDWGCGHPY